jgi:hypothetical protein
MTVAGGARVGVEPVGAEFPSRISAGWRATPDLDEHYVYAIAL